METRMEAGANTRFSLKKEGRQTPQCLFYPATYLRVTYGHHHGIDDNKDGPIAAYISLHRSFLAFIFVLDERAVA